MKRIKQFSLLMVLIALLTACGLGPDDVATDGLTNAAGLGSQSDIMIGGSTMLQNYYEGTVATGGLFLAVSEVVGCEAVFEPNDKNGRIFVHLRPKEDVEIFGKGVSPQFGGSGLLTQLSVGPEMPKESFRASCEGDVGLTAGPIQINGQQMWLASLDLSKAVWKAPAGTELSQFFSENGYRSILLMTTDMKMDVPETAVAQAYDLDPNQLRAYDLNPSDLIVSNLFKAYDLNPNDIYITDSQCGGVILMNTSDSDIGPIFLSSGIMFETLIGTSGMLVLGDGNTLGNIEAQEAETYPFVCDDSNKVQLRSADLGIGEAPYHLVALRYPEITVQRAAGEKEVLTDVTSLGVILAPQSK